MADAKKCDRCGQVYIKRESSKIFGISFSSPDDIIQVRNTEKELIKQYDLCDRCLLDFSSKFMKGAQFVEVPQQESND